MKEKIESLPMFTLNIMDNKSTYRAFEIDERTVVICTFLEDWQTLKNSEPYVLVHSEGITTDLFISFNCASGYFCFEKQLFAPEKISEIWTPIAIIKNPALFAINSLIQMRKGIL